MGGKLLQVDHVIPIHHNFIGGFNKTFGMILPIGVFLHKGLQEAKTGDILITYDSIPIMLLDKVEVAVKSRILEALSLSIYNMPAKRVISLLKRQWGDSMDDDLVLYVVVKQLSDGNKKHIQNQFSLQKRNIHTNNSNRK